MEQMLLLQLQDHGILRECLQSAEGWPVNVGFLGKGSGANIRC